MNILIRLDLEGVTGVVNYAQVEPGSPEYAYGQRMAVNDVNAAIAGCFAGGATRVVVYDMHWLGRNIPLDEFNPAGELICGKPVLSQEFLEQFDALILVGFHGKAGSGTLLAHSYESDTLDIRINGRSVGEIGVEAAIAGELSVPLILVTGDSAGCAEARELMPDVRTVVVKTSLSTQGALCLPTQKTRELMETGAAEAVRNVHQIEPFSMGPMELLEVDLDAPIVINREKLNCTTQARLNGQTLRINTGTIYEAWRTYQDLRMVTDDNSIEP